jgi:hypothetical protein
MSIRRALIAAAAASLLALPTAAAAASVIVTEAARDGNTVTVAGTATGDGITVAIDRPGLDPAEVEYGDPSAIEGGAWSRTFDARGIKHTLAAYARACGLAGCSYASRDLEAIHAVVAVVEGGATNPYHEFFHAGGSLYGSSAPSSVTPEVLEEFGIDESHIIRLTRTGNFAADFAKDQAQFAAIKPGEPYWFEGTNIIGISFSSSGHLSPVSGGTHPVGTTAAVLTANPEAIVVSVQAPSLGLGVGYATIPAGERWSFQTPWVDLTSHSYGPPGSPPLGYHLNDSYRGVVERGKIQVGASDNSPALSPVDATSGPWWTIGVAGFGEGSSEGRVLTSGSLPDFLADFTQNLPYCKSCQSGTSSVSGTSFATPRTAGVLSKILLEARRAAGHTGGIRTVNGVPVMVHGRGITRTNWDLRRALEEAAVYPTGGSVTEPGIPQQAPWTVAGWGVVTPAPGHRVIPEALAHLGISGTPTRFKSADTCVFMTANILARHAYWDVVAPFSQGEPSLNDPYEYCSPV